MADIVLAVILIMHLIPDGFVANLLKILKKESELKLKVI